MVFVLLLSVSMCVSPSLFLNYGGKTYKVPGQKWAGKCIFVIPFQPVCYLRGIRNTPVIIRLAALLSNFTFYFSVKFSQSPM